MPSGTLKWRGLSINVTVPERALKPFRQRGAGSESARPGRVIFQEPPPHLAVRQREPGRGLAFRDVAEAEGHRHAEANGLTGTSDLAERVLSTTWYHTIELPGGITTPGQFDHRELLPRYGLPADLTDQRALDVATFNGYWAFEMERRGARVTAIDLDDPREWDYPSPIRKIVESMGDMGDVGEGFDIAHSALGSSVERMGCSVYQLDPATMGTFEFVHCGDLLLHLRDPLTALERIRSVTSGQMLLCDGIDPSAVRGTYGPTIQYMGGWDDLLWWVPSLDGLAQMVLDAGFREVKVNCVYDLAKTHETQGFWRASLTATV